MYYMDDFVIQYNLHVLNHIEYHWKLISSASTQRHYAYLLMKSKLRNLSICSL